MYYLNYACEPDVNFKKSYSIDNLRETISSIIFSKNSKTAISTLVNYHMQFMGSCIRGRLTLACSEALSIPPNDAILLAACVELLHNASLVHDDLQDGDKERRGQSSVWAKYTPSNAILLGDLFISASYMSLSHLSKHEIVSKCLQYVHFAISDTINGQFNELNVDITSLQINGLNIFENVAADKTGSLFALSVILPMIYHNQNCDVTVISHAMGAFGQLYQIIDDIFDQNDDKNRQSSHVNFMNILKSTRKYADTNEVKKHIELLIQYIENVIIVLPPDLQLIIQNFTNELVHRVEYESAK